MSKIESDRVLRLMVPGVEYEVVDLHRGFMNAGNPKIDIVDFTKLLHAMAKGDLIEYVSFGKY